MNLDINGTKLIDIKGKFNLIKHSEELVHSIIEYMNEVLSKQPNTGVFSLVENEVKNKRFKEDVIGEVVGKELYVVYATKQADKLLEEHNIEIKRNNNGEVEFITMVAQYPYKSPVDKINFKKVNANLYKLMFEKMIGMSLEKQLNSIGQVLGNMVQKKKQEEAEKEKATKKNLKVVKDKKE